VDAYLGVAPGYLIINFTGKQLEGTGGSPLLGFDPHSLVRRPHHVPTSTVILAISEAIREVHPEGDEPRYLR
jgi:hypothetical protein